MHWRKQRRDFKTSRRMIVTHRWKEVHNFLSMSWKSTEFWRKVHIPRSDKRATLLAEYRENKNKHKTNPLKVWNITLGGGIPMNFRIKHSYLQTKQKSEKKIETIKTSWGNSMETNKLVSNTINTNHLLKFCKSSTVKTTLNVLIKTCKYFIPMRIQPLMISRRRFAIFYLTSN